MICINIYRASTLVDLRTYHVPSRIFSLNPQQAFCLALMSYLGASMSQTLLLRLL